MNISFKSILGILLFASAFIFTSCEKENVDKTINEPEVIETKMTINMRGTSVTTNAFAAYCNSNGKEFLTVSNNQDLLGDSLDAQNINDDDFLIYYTSDGTDAYTIGAAVLDEVFMGDTIRNVAFDPSSTVNITSIANDIASGDMSGTFTLSSGTTESYSVIFDADIVQTSPFCD